MSAWLIASDLYSGLSASLLISTFIHLSCALCSMSVCSLQGHYTGILGVYVPGDLIDSRTDWGRVRTVGFWMIDRLSPTCLELNSRAVLLWGLCAEQWVCPALDPCLSPLPHPYRVPPPALGRLSGLLLGCFLSSDVSGTRMFVDFDSFSFHSCCLQQCQCWKEACWTRWFQWSAQDPAT